MRSIRLVVLLASATCVLSAAPARAQARPASGGASAPATPASSQPADEDTPKSSTPKWEVELHVGLGAPLGTPAGSGTLPSTGSVSAGQLSASTFYFGTGASLLNANLASTGASSAAITPLDTVLQTNAISRDAQVLFGLRVQRALTRRLSVSFSGDYVRGNVSFRPSTLTAIEATRSSYITGLQRALASSTLASAVTSVSTITDTEPSQQLRATGSLVVDLTENSRFTPFVTVGGGIVIATEKMPTATIVGSSQLGNDTQIFWTDTAKLHYSQDTQSIVGVGGGGFKYRISPHLGLRAQAEVQMSRNNALNLVDATATRSLETTGAAFPSLTFGNALFNLNGPLNAAAISGAVTRTGSGFESRMVVTTGFYLRF